MSEHGRAVSDAGRSVGEGWVRGGRSAYAGLIITEPTAVDAVVVDRNDRHEKWNSG